MYRCWLIQNSLTLSRRISMIKSFCLTLLLFISTLAFAQEFNTNDSLPSHRAAYHYIGIQSNQLFRQILNLSNTNTAISNPYLIVYAVNNARTGCGVNVSVGVNINDATTGDAAFKRETDASSFSLRVGFEKKSWFGKKWMTSWGVDVLKDGENNKTVATSNFGNNNNSSITTESKINAWGFGGRVTLNYKVTDKIFLGTEASYYLKSGTNKSEVNNATTSIQFDPNTGQTKPVTVSNKTESSEDSKSFQFVVPVALYLILKF